MEDNTRSRIDDGYPPKKKIDDGDDDGEGIVQIQEAQSPIPPRSTEKIFYYVYRSASIGPSLFRKARQRTADEIMINLPVGATITSQSVPGQSIVLLVRPRTLGQTIPKEHNGLVPMQGDEEIFEEQAVCKSCFNILKEENILKTECKCGNALIHEECAANWSRIRGNNYCDSCGQEVQTVPVALVRWLSGSTQMVDRAESNKCYD